MSSIVKMDKQGRLIIPADIRRKLKTNLFLLELSEGNIILKPLEPLSLTSLFDSIEVDVDDFTDTHKLRRALLGGQDS